MRIAAYITDTELRARVAALSQRNDWQLLVCDSTSDVAAVCLGLHSPDLLVSDRLAALLLSDTSDCQRLLLGTEAHLPPGVQAIAPDDEPGLLRSLTHCASVARLRGQFSRLEELEPITRLPRHTEILQNAEMFRGTSVGLIVLQIDHGEHLYADLDPISKTDLLAHLSDYLQAQLGSNMQLGFVNASGFAVLLPQATEQSAQKWAELLVEAFRPGIPFKGTTMHISASAGFAVQARCTDSEALWKRAWTAMLSAARQGGDRAVGESRSELSARIPRAMVRDEFSLVLQAQWKAQGEKLSGVEALLRWQGMEVGELAPSHFIPIAEASGQMARIGDWVIERACAEASTWFEHLLNPIVLALNVSPQQFEKRVINRQIERLTSDRWLDPSMLELELSHEQMLYLVDNHRSSLYALRDMGVRFALDGLGAELIEAQKLLRCPADTLKMDRALIARTGEATADALIGELCALAARFNLRSVAVGVEEQRQYDRLKDLGCTDVQGYLLSKPVPLQEFQGILAQRHAATV